MASFELDTYDLSGLALSMLQAAIAYKRMHPAEEFHVVPLSDFCIAAALPSDLPSLQFLELIKEVKRTSISSRDFEPGYQRSWMAFEDITLKDAHLKFRMCEFALNAADSRESSTKEMVQMNHALTIAVAHANGDAEAFAFHLSAALDGWMSQDMLDADTAMASIRLLRRLHPSISI